MKAKSGVKILRFDVKTATLDLWKFQTKSYLVWPWTLRVDATGEILDHTLL